MFKLGVETKIIIENNSHVSVKQLKAMTRIVEMAPRYSI